MVGSACLLGDVTLAIILKQRTHPMVSMRYRDPHTLSSTLAVLRTLQPLAFGSLNHIETLDSASNYYIGEA